MKQFTIISLFVVICNSLLAQHNKTISLNGEWKFEQTELSYPPQKYSRKITVPGLIHLAVPKIEEYEKFFKRPEKTILKTTHSFLDIDYTPKYSWYKRTITIPKDLKGKEAVLTILKSQYVTQVIVNGHDFGTYMECYTPVEANVTRALKIGEENEILLRVGDRVWLPSEAAGSSDKEKEHYLPGIWDDVYFSFTGKIRVNNILLLPDLENSKLTVKTQLRNFYPAQLGYGDKMYDDVKLTVEVFEKKSGKKVTEHSFEGKSKRDNISVLETTIKIPEPKAWSPDSPFLYEAKVTITENNAVSDVYSDNFGMRDFKRKGKYFYLNGEKTFLRGSNITLQRFFEDPDCGNLAWDREWVKKMLIDHPKEMHWNAMRICVGIVPDFWYDIADEYGIMFQNEWNYWQNHGWDAQIKKEYTNWVWADGNHPSIVIWDAINENWDDYIGNQLIPELMQLDPTRIWDAGYMTAEQLTAGPDEMDEPHPYDGKLPWIDANKFNEAPYPLGNLDYRNALNIKSIESSAAQLVNEYGWIWLWRNGNPSKLAVGVYDYYLGDRSTQEDRREFQAYWLQAETEWLRTIRSHAGVLAFCHLTNNYGYTGDWYINDIANLEKGPTMHWFRHAFAPAGIFINLTDERYTRHLKPHTPGSELVFTLVGVNDYTKNIEGKSILKILDSEGKEILTKEMAVEMQPTSSKAFAVSLTLPENAGGYLIVNEFYPAGQKESVISRRYIKVGKSSEYKYYELKPKTLN